MSRTPRTLWIKAIRKCNGRCWFCGDEANTVDHATPRSRGGVNHIENLLPSCLWCNNTKGDMGIGQFRKYLRALLVRKAIESGAIWGGLDNLKIIFFGENNDSPIRWDD